jgi:hypothetical protein
MKIVNITARFMRRIQPQDYEPAEAELSAQVAFDDGEVVEIADGASRAGDLLLALRAEVYRSLNRQPPADPQAPPPNAKVVTAADVEGGRKGKKTTKTPPTGNETADLGEATPAQAAKPAPQPATAEQTAAAAATAAVATTKAVTAATPSTAAPAVNVKLTLPELLAHLNALVGSSKVAVESVKALYPQFKVTRVAELKEDQIAAFKVALDNLEKTGSASSLNDL